jgi:dTDP-glucose pyrophosphorylase
VDPYEGEGSSLGYSMLQASKYLKKPFVYHASDTIVFDKIPKANTNWIGGYKGIGSSNYTSFNILNGKIQKILEKGIVDPDYLHVGVVGVYDYNKFWKKLAQLVAHDTFSTGLSDYHVINELIDDGIDFKIHEFHKWLDVGNIESLKLAREKINDTFHILDKPEESLFIIDKTVYKFFSNPENIRKRVKRTKFLHGLVPAIQQSTSNFYTYKYTDGDLYADVANQSNIIDLLEWAKSNLWQESNEVSQEEFKKICFDFYNKKTKERVQEMVKTRGVADTETIINGDRVPGSKELLEMIDFDWLSDIPQTNFHGDFILDNIIKTKKGFCLLDWRQDFGGLLRSGDMYYDLAKLNHNLTVNHGIVNDNHFMISISEDNIVCDIHRLERLVRCQNEYWKYLVEKGYDVKKVKVLTGLIWLNMSPLHHHPFDLFLFYFGRYNLWKALHEK